MDTEYFEVRLQHLLAGVSATELQRRLSGMADRDLAMALRAFVDEDRRAIESRLPEAKARRVREELEYLSRLRIRGDQIRHMAERLIAVISGDTSPSGGSWISPGRR